MDKHQEIGIFDTKTENVDKHRSVLHTKSHRHSSLVLVFHMSMVAYNTNISRSLKLVAETIQDQGEHIYT